MSCNCGREIILNFLRTKNVSNKLKKKKLRKHKDQRGQGEGNSWSLNFPFPTDSHERPNTLVGTTETKLHRVVPTFCQPLFS